MTTKEELAKLKVELGFASKVECTESEQKEFTSLEKSKQPLSDDIIWDAMYCRVVDNGLTSEEKQQLMQFRQTNYLHTIKNSLVFLVVVAAIGLLFGLYAVLSQVR